MVREMTGTTRTFWPALAVGLSVVLLASASGQGRRQTLRDVLREDGAADLGQFPQDLLDAPIDDERRGGRYVRLSFHVNPSAERLLVLSPDMALRRELYGWELAMLPNHRIVYHHSQIHFAPTHWLEMSIFDPATLKEKQIYPPKPYQPIRRNFIERVTRAYRERVESWFREHNHHMDPELFDSALVGDVRVDATRRLLSFTVRFGETDNANDPLPFSELVRVTCQLTDRIEQVRCRERDVPAISGTPPANSSRP
jgi:hypothetical protein